MAATVAPDRISINLRTDATSRDLIDRAAEALGKNRSEFMLEAARREATEVLLDRRLFLLDDQAYKRFTAALTDGRSVAVTGIAMTLDAMIELLEELLAKARKARPKGLELDTFLRLLRDEANGGKPC